MEQQQMSTLEGMIRQSTNNPLPKPMNYQDIYVIEDFEEAEQFRYEHNDQPVEVGTPVAFDHLSNGELEMVCFEGIYFQSDE
jgi:hypothetical protein